jgi:hypothetical protein
MDVIKPCLTWCNTPGIDLPDDATPLTNQHEVYETTLKSDNSFFVMVTIPDRKIEILNS